MICEKLGGETVVDIRGSQKSGLSEKEAEQQVIFNTIQSHMLLPIFHQLDQQHRTSDCLLF